MEIQVVSVGQPNTVSKNGKAWSEVEIQYISKNGPGKKSVKSFEGDVYKAIQQLGSGDNADIKLEKKGQYWNWMAVTKLAGGQSQPSQQPQPYTGGQNGGSKKGDWPTKEERDNTQHYIVRQSALERAHEFIGLSGVKPEAVTVGLVCSIAQQYENFVFTGSLPESVSTEKPKGRKPKVVADEDQTEEME